MIPVQGYPTFSLMGEGISNVSPLDSQVLTFNATTMKWEARTPTVNPLLKQFDDTTNKASLSAGATFTYKSYSGLGYANIVVAGDGDPDVNVTYSRDGGGDIVISASNIQATISVSFSTSLVLKAKNTNLSVPKNYSTESNTGIYQ